jgi:DNA-binding NarL/FixJ family response regulator
MPTTPTYRAREALRRWRRTAGDRWDPPLTDRQREVVRRYCDDLSPAEIAAELRIAEGTVQRTLHDASVRLGLAGDRRYVKGTICWAVGAAAGDSGGDTDEQKRPPG